MADTERLLGSLAEAFTFTNLTELPARVIELLGHLVPYDSAGYNEIAPDEMFAVTIRLPERNRRSYAGLRSRPA